MKLSFLKEKRILILGFGREGKDTLLFLRKIFPEKQIGIADKLEIKNLKLEIKDYKKIKWYFGKDYLKAIDDYDIIIKSPGIPIHLPEIEKAKKEKKLTSQTEIFFENCPGMIIGITGTKGKSTTTSLIYKVLKNGGIKAHLVGNIGKPVLSSLLKASQKDVFVYELSCHQLWNLKHSPHIAVFLNLYPEHLDYYKSFQEYARAKANICLWQTKDDFLIYNAKDENVKKFAKKSKAKKVALKNYSNTIKNVGIKKIPLIGEHNLLNISAAIEVGKIFKIQNKKIKEAVENFKPLHHRLELVGTFKDITFYNDSLATIPETTIAAIDAFGNKAETIILGGYDRNLSFKKLAEKVLNSGIKTVILFPTTGEKIWKDIEKLSKVQKLSNLPQHFFVDNMKDAVKLAFENTHKGKVCLLSCASSSFSLFRDYKEKGNLFKKWVRCYGNLK
ncbi:MAG TPA: UDP-N-acetylmuramoyl-L-alanine--D-glutamate ligase [Candidatus Pacearchaeota archaeon]|nr:UDP-N-acetylmuramoyl-L-alanine--D-glutamate ligase [Candidatus Pacearchaeota archaeon]HOK93959.1 UDP-N-acetylmuramoyl-L-alanine--D-glutamate ligase [Candidatus Pacearchaeota archaeon]HPO75030.1 UDP-N-acetylmuramoyl-L-alanine--D-glutamate ligase [Candidatus Pacearchaeota archaeon]